MSLRFPYQRPLEGDQIEAIEEIEKKPEINLQPKVTGAMQMARLYGGIYMGIAGKEPADPLDVDRVGPISRDVTSAYYGQPEWYEVIGSNGTLVRVHPSRMIRFIGAPVLDNRYHDAQGWGDSVLQIVYEAVRNATSVQAHIAALLPEAKSDVIYIPKLSEYLRNPTTTKALTDRSTYANSIKSMFNMMLLEGNGARSGSRSRSTSANCRNRADQLWPSPALHNPPRGRLKAGSRKDI